MKKCVPIRTAAKMLGVSPSALRFYERKGFIASGRDAQSGYRYYRRPNFTHIIRARFLQSLGFTLGQASESLLEGWDVRTWQDALRQQQDDIALQQQKLAKAQVLLAEQQAFLDGLPAQVGAYRMVQSEPMYWFCHSDEQEQMAEDPRDLQQASVWMDRFPLVRYVLRVNRAQLSHVEDDPQLFTWGFGVSAQDFPLCRFDPSDAYVTLPAQTCVYTVVRLPLQSGVSADTRLMRGAMAYIRAQGLQVAGDAWGRYRCALQEPDAVYKYYEVYIPVQR